MTNQIRNKKILITAGPTREWMDPVRFLSNPSTGSMGIVLAQTLEQAGANVTLVMGPTHLAPPKNVRVVRVVTGLQMATAVKKNLSTADAFIGTAAVGDWRFSQVASSKLKKKPAHSMRVKLVKNPDIIAAVSRARKNILVVGFALETDHQQKNAIKKLREKKLNLIIANKPDSFASESIHPLWIESTGRIQQFQRMSKKQLARKISLWLKMKWKK